MSDKQETASPPLHELLIKMFVGGKETVFLKEINAMIIRHPKDWPAHIAVFLMLNGHIPKKAYQQCIDALLEYPYLYRGFDGGDLLDLSAQALIKFDGVSQLQDRLLSTSLRRNHLKYLQALQNYVGSYLAKKS